jgi:hypothetical protein
MHFHSFSEQKEPPAVLLAGDNEAMPEGKHPDHHHDDTGPHLPHEQQKPYWQRAHKDWKFWVGVVFIAAAIVIYVLSLDLSTVPHPHT